MILKSERINISKGINLNLIKMDKFKSNLLSIYLPLTIIGIITLVLMAILPETEKNPEIKVETKELISVIKKPTNFKALLIAFLFLAAPIFLMNFLGIYLSSIFNIGQLKIGYIYTIVALGTMFGIIFAGLFIDKIGKEKLAKISYTLVFISLIALFISKNLYFIINISSDNWPISGVEIFMNILTV